MAVKKKNKGGAPTKYKKDYARQANVACAERGFTDIKLAKLFGVNKATITNWKKERPEFLASIKKGKEEYDTELVEKSLLKRALGYKYTEVTKEPTGINKDGEMGVIKKVRKEVTPDTKAQIFWVRNRNRDRWPDVTVSEGSIKVEKAEEVKDIGPEATAKEAEATYRDMMGLGE